MTGVYYNMHASRCLYDLRGAVVTNYKSNRSEKK